MKLSVMIPVYQGDNLFKECLESLKPHLNIFSTIYISINKSPIQETDLQTAKKFSDEVFSSVKIIVFVQKRELSAKNHGVKFWSDISKVDQYTDFFIMLCHDDILLPNFSKVVESLFQNNIISPDVVINPARSLYKENFVHENFYGTYYGLLSYPDCKVSKELFTRISFDCYPETNMSGLIYHKNCAKEIFETNFLHAYGYRAEYRLMCAANISYVAGTKEPIVGIRLHKSQQGAAFYSDKMERDELFYILYAMYSTHDVEFTDYMKNKLLSFPIKYFLKNFFLFVYINTILMFYLKKIDKGIIFFCVVLYNIAKKIVRKILK